MTKNNCTYLQSVCFGWSVVKSEKGERKKIIQKTMREKGKAEREKKIRKKKERGYIFMNKTAAINFIYQGFYL